MKPFILALLIGTSLQAAPNPENRQFSVIYYSVMGHNLSHARLVLTRAARGGWIHQNIFLNSQEQTRWASEILSAAKERSVLLYDRTETNFKLNADRFVIVNTDTGTRTNLQTLLRQVEAARIGSAELPQWLESQGVIAPVRIPVQAPCGLRLVRDNSTRAVSLRLTR
jgi:hypothetical protein